MPGCDFTRRDLLRWTAVATASPLLARTRFLSGVAEAATSRGAISAVNLELVTLTEDRAVITWYTGFTGTDDGLKRMQPARAEGSVHWGTHPDRLKRVAHDHDYTPYHHVELTGLEPGQTYYYRAQSNGKPATPMPFTLIDGNAVGTSDYGLTTGGPYSFTTPEPPAGPVPLLDRAVQRPPHGRDDRGARRRPPDRRDPAGARPAALSGSDAEVARQRRRASSAPRTCWRRATSPPKRSRST